MAAGPSPRADAARGRLMDAAEAAFAQHGYHGTTTRHIAAAAGMSPAALYVHHASKEELLFLISRAGHEEVLSLLDVALRVSDDPVAQLRAVVRYFTLFHVAAHDSARIVNYELAALTQRAGDPLIARVASHLASLSAGESGDAATARLALRQLHTLAGPQGS